MNDTGTASVEMPRYKCHKDVHALKIAAVERQEGGSALLTPHERETYAPFEVDADWLHRFHGKTDSDDDLGYYVVYADGYRSWSPTEAFEEGYDRL